MNPGVETIDPGFVREARRVRRVMVACWVVYAISTALTIAAVVHNNHLSAYAIGMDTTRPYLGTGIAGLLLLLLWPALSRVRPSMASLVAILAILITTLSVGGQYGARACQRPLWGSASYDAAIKEVSDRFWEAQKLSPAGLSAVKLVDRTDRDSGASAADLHAAIEACDVLINRVEENAAFLGSWSRTSREILRKHALTEKRVEWYAEAWERLYKVPDLIQDDIRLATEYRKEKEVLQSRLAAAAKGEVMP